MAMNGSFTSTAAEQAGQKGSNEEGEERLEKMRMMARKAGA